jgi:hypothetical protein
MAEHRAEPVELRIHGVGGSTPEKLLGERDALEVVEVERGHRTGLWARWSDPSVRGYVWGGLTSGAKLQPLWVVLLPFTLANVAGWMHPRVTGDPRRIRQVHDIRRLVTVLGYTLTATWALWLAIVVADLLVYQGGEQVEPVDTVPFLVGLAVGVVVLVAGLLWKRWLPLLAAGGVFMVAAGAARSVGSAHVRALAGVVLAEAVLGVLVVIAGVSRRQYESHTTEITPSTARPTVSNEDLRSPTFFARPYASRRLLKGHVVLIVVLTLLLGLRAFAQVRTGQPALAFGGYLVALNALQLVLLAVLGVRSLGEWKSLNRRWRVAGPAVAMGLAIILTNAVFSGLTLFVANRINGAVTGAELALVDQYVELALLLVAVLLLGWFPYFLAAKPPPADPGAPPDELKWRGKRFVRQRMARVFRHVDVLCSAAVGFMVVAGLIATVTRTDTLGSPLPWKWTIDRDGGLAPFRSAAAWLLPFAVPLVGGLVRGGARSGGKRRNIGNLWDVTGIWPRHFHPLAVRPYAERAVPELQEHIRRSVAGAGAMVVSAHSQGTVIAFAALCGLSCEVDLGRVALVTYGSPLARLHARFFPAYFGPSEMAWLRRQLFCWRNFYRKTDHIGQSVFDELPEAAEDDRELPDPAEGTLDLTPHEGGPEADRVPWRDVAGHNDYPREPELKRCVRQVKAELQASVTAGGSSPHPSPPIPRPGD